MGVHLSLDPIGPVCACSESSRCFFFISTGFFRGSRFFIGGYPPHWNRWPGSWNHCKSPVNPRNNPISTFVFVFLFGFMHRSNVWHLQCNSTNYTIHWSCPMGMVIWGWSMFWTLIHDTIHLDMFLLFYTYDLYNDDVLGISISILVGSGWFIEIPIKAL